MTRWPLPVGSGFPTHRHRSHQLSVATGRAPLALRAEGRTWIVLPDRALWVPAGIDHSVDALGPAEMTTLWLDPAAVGPLPWRTTVVVRIGPLGLALVARLLEPDLALDARGRTEAVLLDILEPVEVDVLDLPLPADDRARRVAEALLTDPADGRTLVAWGRSVGASDRTLQRTFLAGTGVGFHEWRARARIGAALQLLLTDRPIAAIAGDVGFATTSAFGAAFRRMMGVAPSVYGAGSPPGDGQ